MLQTIDRSITTTEFAAQLVREGACLCWPAAMLTVPIPLIDIRFHASRIFTWAATQTPFGGERPQFGVVEYAEQRREGGGATYWDEAGRELCAILPNHLFGFPVYHEAKLQAKAQYHHLRLSEDEAYAALWDERFSKGTAQCIADGQLRSAFV